MGLGVGIELPGTGILAAASHVPFVKTAALLW